MADCDLKHETFEEDSDSTSNPVQEYKRYTYLQNVSHWKLFVFREKRSEDLRVQVLLNNADRYINESIAWLPSQGSQELAPQLVFPNGTSSEETTWALLPGSWSQEDTETLLDEITQMAPAMMDNSSTGMNISTDTTPGSSSFGQGQVARGSALPGDPLVDVFPPTREDLLKDLGRGPELDVAGPMPQDERNLPSSALATNPAEEASIWDAVSQEDLLCNSLCGSFEILPDNYLQDWPLDDVFMDIDTSAFDGIPVPSNEQSRPACTSQEVGEGPQPEAVHLPDQNLSSGAGAEHMEHLFNSE